ncbi:MAG: hypothetical protein AAB568_00385 [Patescibacteria group bacterium]
MSTRGLFIVFEGLDKAGKTTLAKMVVEKIGKEKILYQKGLCSPTWIGKLSARRPSTFIFLIEITYLYWKTYFKRLKGTHAVQDRFFASLACHLPDVKKIHNALLIKLGRWLLPHPDVLIYCTVSKEERIKRLKEDGGNEHHQWLIDHHEFIDFRENLNKNYFTQFEGDKIYIDTSSENTENSAKKILNLLTKNGRLLNDRLARC